ncbi:MAG TPA: hypothetical protein VGP19_12440 [Candidatus Acidoferrales bacterium]|nr:hypothetical protein [Candidatus Acidoferrales bacterium]
MAIRSSESASVSMITVRRSGEGRGGAWAATRAGHQNATSATRNVETALDSEAQAGWARDAIGLI